MSDITIRKAEIKDAAGIAEVHVKTWQCAYKGQLPDSYLDSLSIEKRTKTWREQIKSPQNGAHTFVAEINSKVVGWCTAGKSRDEDADKTTGEIYGIYIHPDFIGKGCGSMLMESGLNLLRKDGYKRATLWVLDSNEKTRKWYEDKGWKIEGKTKIGKRDDFDLHETRYLINIT